MNPNIHEAFDRLKEQGKLRFLGVSSHTPRLEAVMRHAVDSDRFDVIMVAYNFRNWPELTNIFHDAKRKGVGVVAMKTLKGARHSALSDFTPTERESFSQAAFKWVLSNPDVSGLVVTIGSFHHIDEYLHASGQPFQQTDLALLEKYDVWLRTTIVRRAVASACLPVRPMFRSMMSCATPCIMRTTASSGSAWKNTPGCHSPGTPPSVSAVGPRAKAPVPTRFRFRPNCSGRTGCSDLDRGQHEKTESYRLPGSRPDG